MDNDGVHVLDAFHRLYSNKLNNRSILFLFKHNGIDTVCRISDMAPKLQIVDNFQEFIETTQSTWKSIQTSDVSHSIFSFMHNYMESDNKMFLHKDANALPCSSIHIPIWISNKSLEEFLNIWYFDKLNVSHKWNFISMTFNSNEIHIFKLYHSTMGKHRTYIFK
jgi:hypothetical protein